MKAKRPLRLLVSARDPGAAGHMREIVRQALKRDDIEVRLAAQSPAFEMLAAAGLPVEPFPAVTASGVDDPRAPELLAAADALLARTEPDVVLAGLSGPDAGIDEALLLRARTPHTFAMQDYWGDVNVALGKPAHCYLVLDEEAVAISRARFGVRAVAVGSPKHAAYRELDVPGLRAAARGQLGLDAGNMLIGWFGQPLWQHPEYAQTVGQFGAAIGRVPPTRSLLYRPHPKESPPQRRQAQDLLAAGGRRVLELPGSSVESCLAACEWVCSVFSSCGLDAIMLNGCTSPPARRVLYFVPEAMAGVYRAYTGLDQVPAARSGLAVEAHSTDALVAMLAGGDDARSASDGKPGLVAPPASAQRVLDILTAAARR